MVADELRRQADHFLDLDELAPMIMRDHVAKPVAADEDNGDDFEQIPASVRS